MLVAIYLCILRSVSIDKRTAAAGHSTDKPHLRAVADRRPRRDLVGHPRSYAARSTKSHPRD